MASRKKHSYEEPVAFTNLVTDENDTQIIGKCICLCCSRSTYCKSTNRLELCNKTYGKSKNMYEFRCKKFIKIKRFNLLFFKFFVKLFSDLSTGPNVRLKLIKILFFIFILLVILFLIFYRVQIIFVSLMSNSVQNKLSYDLMRHALQEQNITRFHVTCSIPDLYKRELNRNFIKQKESSLKFELFTKFYLKTKINKNIEYKTLLVNNKNDSVSKLIENFKFCSIKKFDKYFISKSVFNNSGYNYKSLLYTNKKLNRLELDLLNIDSSIAIGGHFRAPLCIQEYLYYVSSHDEIDELSRLDFQNLNQVSNFSYQILKKHYEYSISKRKIIQNFINLKQNYFTVIIIPYRNRENNLIDLLSNLHSFLQRQFLHYKIVIAEQSNKNEAFNKGRLYNTAYRFVAQKWPNKVNCLILHDVDLIPESDLNIYECDNNFYNNLYTQNLDPWTYTPRHLSSSIRKDINFDLTKTNLSDVYIKSPYELLVGGVLCIKPQVFEHINGFSNEYWNWGAEDDDLAMRMIAKNVCITRSDSLSSLYKMSNHTPSDRNPVRENLLFTSVKRMNKDGLSNLNSLNTFVSNFKEYALYTHLEINVGKPDANYFSRFNNTNPLAQLFNQLNELSKKQIKKN